MPPHCTGNKTTSNLLSLKIVLYSSPMKMPRDHHLCAHFFTPGSWSNSHTKPSLIDPKLLQSLLNISLLRHSFYFYLYFEHLNFTWSYLGDLISWSTILSWSLDLIIWWWSKIRFFIWTLHYYLHAFDMPLTHVFHWRSTCILHMLLRNMLLPYTWHALDTCFTCVYLEDNTWTLVYNCS